MPSNSPMNGVLPPFRLPSEVVYFLDWRYVDHGYLRWLDPANQPVPVMPAPQPLPPVHSSDEWLPCGVRIEAIPARADPEPTLRAANLGETLFFGGSVLHDDGVYRLFYESCHPDALAPEKVKQIGHIKYLRYGESDDGVTWRFPLQNRVECAGSRANNIVFDPGFPGYHGGCVFRDPQGPAAERYKSVWLGYVTTEELRLYRERWPEDVDPMAVFKEPRASARPGSAAWGMRGAVSPDGLAWSLLPDPLLIQHSDTFNAAAYDPLHGCYVIYPRTWFYGRRAVGRATSADFRHFSGLTQVLWPDPGMRPTDTWYTPGYATMPGAPDWRLSFATLWSQVDDSFSPVLHSSADGILWQRVPGPELLAHGPPGSWYHCGGAVTGLVPLPGGRMGSLIMGWHVPHKYPRVMPGFGQAGWISWERDRLAALKADGDGRFSLYPLRTQGRKLVLNCRTAPDGFIAVAVNGAQPLRAFADCDAIAGDETARVVTWHGESDLRHGADEAVQVQFRLHKAELFSVRFV